MGSVEGLRRQGSPIPAQAHLIQKTNSSVTTQHVNDKMMQDAAHIFPHNIPNTKEAYCCRMIFERFFPQNSARLSVPGGASVACSTANAVEWDAAWSNNLDPSVGAALGVHLFGYEGRAAPVSPKVGIVPGEVPHVLGVNAAPDLAIIS